MIVQSIPWHRHCIVNHHASLRSGVRHLPQALAECARNVRNLGNDVAQFRQAVNEKLKTYDRSKYARKRNGDWKIEPAPEYAALADRLLRLQEEAQAIADEFARLEELNQAKKGASHA